ncbi:MAG: bifunctional methylenetetrahydrofolate dehydrogenase/methenyltetrahydrofolate cyclohydrolase FolD [Defluviitaleaceae bacterium]|nr:bifunctional methylenetetrahydrofolate dehydrogenase/methenyltetrahydrofolate cyclohydrolase FolD [Defluviitaleaceae bacterium]
MGTLIDGKKHAANIRGAVKEQVDGISGPKPHLAVVLVGENPASITYIKNKRKACEETGIGFSLHTLPEFATQEEVLDTVAKLNEDSGVHGILVQQPLPPQVDKNVIEEAVDPLKDVDCLHPFNLGIVATGRPRFSPCTPGGVVELLKREGIEITGKNAVIIGRSDIVGKPLAFMLLNESATVTICHSKTQNLADICRQADILVAAIGRAKFITADYVKKGAVVIDVGINRENGKLCGDVDFDNVKGRAAYITPVPGGVGPMTIAMLMENCVKAWALQMGAKPGRTLCAPTDDNPVELVGAHSRCAACSAQRPQPTKEVQIPHA